MFFKSLGFVVLIQISKIVFCDCRRNVKQSRISDLLVEVEFNPLEAVIDLGRVNPKPNKEEQVVVGNSPYFTESANSDRFFNTFPMDHASDHPAPFNSILSHRDLQSKVWEAADILSKIIKAELSVKMQKEASSLAKSNPNNSNLISINVDNKWNLLTNNYKNWFQYLKPVFMNELQNKNGWKSCANILNFKCFPLRRTLSKLKKSNVLYHLIYKDRELPLFYNREYQPYAATILRYN